MFEPVFAALERAGVRYVTVDGVAVGWEGMSMSQNDDRAAADGWEQHRRAELESVSLTTPADRLRWLEEAIAFAFRAGGPPSNQRRTSATAIARVELVPAGLNDQQSTTLRSASQAS